MRPSCCISRRGTVRKRQSPRSSFLPAKSCRNSRTARWPKKAPDPKRAYHRRTRSRVYDMAAATSRRTVFYASIGPALTAFDVDIGGAALIKRSTVTLPANVQYAWPHPSRRYLYVVSSNGGPGILDIG